MESVLRHCFVKMPKEFAKANNGGDDIFFCEYEYDIHWHSFKRLAEIDNDKEVIMLEERQKNIRILIFKNLAYNNLLVFMR